MELDKDSYGHFNINLILEYFIKILNIFIFNTMFSIEIKIWFYIFGNTAKKIEKAHSFEPVTQKNIVLPDTCHRRLMKLLNCLNYFESIWCIMRVQTKIWVYLGFHDTLLLIFKFVHVAQGVFSFIFSFLSSFLIPVPIHLSKEMWWHIIWKDTYLCKKLTTKSRHVYRRKTLHIITNILFFLKMKYFV